MFSFLRKTKVHPFPEGNVTGDGKKVSATKVSVPVKPPEAGKAKKSFLKRLFGQRKKPDSTSDKSKEPKKSKIAQWFQKFNCCASETAVATTFKQKEPKKPQSRVPETPKKKTKQKGCHRNKVVPLQPAGEEHHKVEEELPQYEYIIEHFIMEAIFQQEFEGIYENVGISDKVRETHLTVDKYGFPNIKQSCYMNASLQSLLTLEDFVRDISQQEEIWSSVPEAQLLRGFMAIRDAHASTDIEKKRRLLHSFKKAVSGKMPQFDDNEQKDAHEFLTSVLNQIRALSPLLQEKASKLGRKYICPVENHLAFKMENIRTCKTCGVQSRRTEEFINLSLDLIPGGSVEEMIQDYQKETELEYRCDCGGNVSRMRMEFKTLPKVLMLHLKRFCYSPSFELMKLQDPVKLLRDLVLSSQQEASCCSLVSMINHYGYTGAGHYICDSIDPDDDPDKPTDYWLTFNDSEVKETSGTFVCNKRQESAYILFYNRHV